MSAALDVASTYGGDGAADAFEHIEFEIALDLEDPVLLGFERSVREAATAVGGEFLFDMPAEGAIGDASRIAAVRIPREPRDTILFAVLNSSGTRLRAADRNEIGERFHGFARAFVGVLERMRSDRPAPMTEQPRAPIASPAA